MCLTCATKTETKNFLVKYHLVTESLKFKEGQLLGAHQRDHAEDDRGFCHM